MGEADWATATSSSFEPGVENDSSWPPEAVGLEAIDFSREPLTVGSGFFWSPRVASDFCSCSPEEENGSFCSEAEENDSCSCSVGVENGFFGSQMVAGSGFFGPPSCAQETVVGEKENVF